MVILFFSYIFCNMCPWYFQNNLEKKYHSCKIDEYNCFYSILTPEMKADIKKLQLENYESHKKMTENIEEIDDFLSEIFIDIRNLRSYKYNNDKFYKENSKLELIALSINKCCQELKIYQKLLLNDSLISISDQIHKIEKEKCDFYISNAKLFLETYNASIKPSVYNFDSNKYLEESKNIKHKIEKNKMEAQYYKEICEDKDKVLKKIKKYISEFKKLTENRIGNKEKNITSDLKNNFLSYLLDDHATTKISKHIKKLKKIANAFLVDEKIKDETNVNSNYDKTVSTEAKMENQTSLNNSDVKELECQVDTKIKIVLYIFEDIIEILNFINSYEQKKREYEFEYYLHEKNKLKEFKKFIDFKKRNDIK